MHAPDFGALIGINTRCVSKHLRRLTAGLTGKEFFYHCERTFVMLDHEGEKESVKGRIARLIELLHLLGGEHPRHGHGHGRVGIGHHLLAILEPLRHRSDFVALRDR